MFAMRSVSVRSFANASLCAEAEAHVSGLQRMRGYRRQRGPVASGGVLRCRDDAGVIPVAGGGGVLLGRRALP